MIKKIIGTFVLCWMVSGVLLGQTNPSPFSLSQGNYSLIQWPSASAAGTYPTAMKFHTCNTVNAGLTAPTSGDFVGAYNGNSGARVNGLSANGFYIAGVYNTTPTMGAAVLGLNSIGRGNINVSFQTSTILTGNPANLRLQYRIASNNSNWMDVPGPVEYVSNGATSLTPTTFNINLSTLTSNAINDRPDFQLRWKYYRTGGAGVNDCAIAIDEITVTSTALPSSSISTGLAPALQYCVTPTVGTPLVLNFSYTPSASFSVGSNFIVEMSNASGSFSVPVACGIEACDGSGNQNMTVTIPANTQTGSGYRLRVRNAGNGVVGNDNGADIQIDLVPLAVTAVVPNARYRQVLLNWVNPTFCWDEVMVVAREGSLPSTTPTGNGSQFTANAQYGLGSSFGGGYIMYKGTGTSVNMTGLTSDVSYGVVIWTRFGDDWISISPFSVITTSIPALSSAPVKIAQAEYFWNLDPGTGNGTSFLVEDGAYDRAFEKILKSGLSAPNKGRNLLNVRVKDGAGLWSNVFTTVINVDSVDTFMANSGYGGGKVIQAEYWWNTDPGVGNGTTLIALDGNLNSAFENVFKNGINTVKKGRSTFNVRVKDKSNNWSSVFSTVVNVDSTDTHPGYTLTKLVQAEYWWDTDPGVGNAITVLALDGNLNAAFEGLVKNGLQAPHFGRSTFNIRVKDNSNNWSGVFSTIINVDSSDTHPGYPLTRLIQAECWWNNDPGEGNGMIVIAADGNLGQAFEQLFKNGLTAPNFGRNKFGMRVKATDNTWSTAFYTVVNVDSLDTNMGYPLSKLTQAEYWWNNDPGVGNGATILALDGNLNAAFEGLVKNGLTAPRKGKSTFNVRVKDHLNNWSGIFSTVINVDSTTTVGPLFTAQRIKQQEYYWDVDPGEGNGTVMLPEDGFSNSGFERFKVAGNYTQNLPNGVHILGMRTKDANGVWSDPFKTTVDVNFLGNTFAVYTNPAYAVRCQGQSVTLNALGGVSYNWSPSTGLNTTIGATVIATPLETTTYSVVGVNSFGLTDTAYITVQVTSPASIIGATQLDLCPGASLELSSSSNLGNYWSTGSTAQTITVSQGGVYTLVSENGCGINTSSVTVNMLPVTIPVISADGPTQFCIGSGVGLSAGDGVEFLWSNGSTDPSIFVQETGSYSVTVTPDGGCPSTSLPIQVTASSVPDATITASGSTTICAGGFVTLTAPAGSNLTYLWLKDGIEIADATTNQLNVIASGFYNCVVTYLGCSSLSNMITVNVTPLPNSVITPASSTTICAGGSVLLQGPVGTGITYQWKLNNNSISGATASSYSASVAGNYTLTINSNGCVSVSSPITVTVNPLPTANITVTGNLTFCQGGSVTFTASAGTGNTYQWYKNAVPIDGAVNQTYTANSAGIYHVVVTKLGCSATSATRTVVVNPVPVATITPAGSTGLCTGGSVMLNATTGTGYSYQWKLNNINITGATGTAYTAIQAGNYTLTVIASGCSATSSIVPVQVGSPITASISAGGSTTFCSGNSVLLSANTGTGLTYQWKLNGENISGATSATYVATAQGNYSCVVANNGCPSTSNSIAVTVTAPFTVDITAQGSTSICPGGSVMLSTNPVAGYLYSWKLNGDTIPGAHQFEYAAFQGGVYTLDVAYTNCVVSSNSITVTEGGQSIAISPSGTVSICGSASQILTATTGNGFTYQWYKDNVAMSGQNASVLTVNVSGSYTVSVSSLQCSGTSSPTVVNATSPVTPSVSIASSDADNAICSGTSVTFTATPTNGGTTPAYQWKLNGTNVGTNASTYTNTSLNNNDAVTVVLTANNACQTSATANGNSITTTVSNSVTPSVSIASSDADNAICSGTSVTFTATPTNGGTTPAYQWKLNGTNVGTNASTYTNASLNNNDAVTVVLTANNACQTSATANGNSITTVVTNPITWYLDADADGYFVSTQTSCTSPGAGYTSIAGNSGDCNDLSNLIYPNAVEFCDNGIDEDCDGQDELCLGIPGCTDPTAINFDPVATEDDGSCIAAVLGCTDASAFNYNAAANTDDGSCIAVVLGCTDATAFNYNAAANTDDGSCIAVVLGCTDVSAFNYNPAANTDDGSCIAVVLGCTDETAFNYNAAANTDDGSCIAVVLGCTDATAFNYNPAANTDDGSCIAVVLGCTDATAFNYNPAANTDDGSCIAVVLGCTDATAFNYNPAANTDDGSCIAIVLGCTDETAFNYNPSANTDDGSCIAVVLGCTDEIAFNYNPSANTDDGSCIAVVLGCTDETAFNYNPSANTDDGSCIAVVLGCTDATAFNYNAAANTDDGSCIAVVLGCTDEIAFNYNPSANTDDGSCIAVVLGCTDATAFNYNAAANTDDGSCIAVVLGCTDETAFNYNASANTDDGSCIAVVLGCTDALAFNYNPAANTDDGSCIAVVEGCTDVAALNYNPAANTDDGSCIAVVLGCTDVSAFNYNPSANTDDGSCIAVVEGCTDMSACNYDFNANVDDGSCILPQPETCNDLDDDCNGLTDDGLEFISYFIDADQDGVGSIYGGETCNFNLLPGFSYFDGDCDDNDPMISPFMNEVCNGVDDNCDGEINEGLGILVYLDDDGDGFGNDGIAVDGVCELAPGLVEIGGDCNDQDASVNPEGIEICDDGLDNNCDGLDEICPIYGCTDPTAFNYDALANMDDGSCIAVVLGCTDPTAFNYNAAANTDDGSCIAVVLGCTDASAFNYNPSANTDDGSCIAVVLGCTDETAFNYNAAANTDDGSCIAVVLGCTDASAFNYNPSANTDDGSCIAVVLGCTDASAFNYNPSANTDDGSCIAAVLGCTDASAFNYNAAANTDDGSCIAVVLGCTDATAFNYNAAANTDDGSCIAVVLGCTDETAFNYNPSANTDDGSCIAVVLGCTDASAFNFNPAANTDDGSCIAVVLGCTDATAFNFNPAANTDDGSCIAIVLGCTDETAFNYNPSANTDDGSCIAVVLGCTDETAFNYNPSANTDDGSCIAVVLGCTDEIAFNYNPSANTDDGSCITVVLGCTDEVAFNFNPAANTDDGSCIAVVLGCTDATAFNFNPAANTDDGSCIAIVLGCTDETAFNYNPSANTDDGSCIAVVEGCTDINACNYDFSANADNGSCVLPQPETCNDLDDNCDGQIDEDVLLTFYADLDQDGFGNIDDITMACSQPNGYVADNSDCNDEDDLTYPGALEICDNSRDEDCDGEDLPCVINVLGCTDPSACNYNELANTDDGSCVLPQPEICNGLDDNCDGAIDEGLTLNGLTVVSTTTAIYPTCSGNSIKSANLNNGSNSGVIEGNGNDLWFSLSAQYNTLRAGLSAASGDNDIRLYEIAPSGCLQLLEVEHEITTGNQTLITDQLTVGSTYYVAVHNISGAMNASAKICFNHLTGSICDHYYSNNTGIYTSVCNSFKAQYRANAVAYTFDVLSATQNGVNQNITPWSYTTTSSSSVVSRLGSILPANQGTAPVIYTLRVPVVYSLPDAAGNLESISALATSTCSLTLNAEPTIALRSSDRCPNNKAINSYVAPDRTVCGAMRYDWEFTEYLPTLGQPQVIQGGAYASVFFLNNVPGIAIGKTYGVRVRPVHASGIAGNWGASQCLRIGSAGMVLQNENQNENDASKESQVSGISIYPNPTTTGSFVLQYNVSRRGELLFALEPTTTESNSAQELKMMDIAGKVVHQEKVVLNGNAVEIKFGDLASGVYVVMFGEERMRLIVE